MAIAQATNQATEGKPATQQAVKQEESVDWDGMSNADLWATKIKGASEEKIRRSFFGCELRSQLDAKQPLSSNIDSPAIALDSIGSDVAPL